jgi:hypothetical protein
MISKIMTIILLDHVMYITSAMLQGDKAHSMGRGDGGGDEK